MKLVTYVVNGQAKAGVLNGEVVTDLASCGFDGDMKSLLNKGEVFERMVQHPAVM